MFWTEKKRNFLNYFEFLSIDIKKPKKKTLMKEKSSVFVHETVFLFF